MRLVVVLVAYTAIGLVRKGISAAPTCTFLPFTRADKQHKARNGVSTSTTYLLCLTYAHIFYTVLRFGLGNDFLDARGLRW